MDSIQINKEMANRHYDEALEFLSKWGAFLSYVGIGLVGKFGYDLVNKKHLTFWYILGTGCVALCIGFLAYQWCKGHPTANPGIIIPIITLVSRDVMLFVTMIDWQGVLKLVTGKGVKDKNGEQP